MRIRTHNVINGCVHKRNKQRDYNRLAIQREARGQHKAGGYTVQFAQKEACFIRPRPWAGKLDETAWVSWLQMQVGMKERRRLGTCSAHGPEQHPSRCAAVWAPAALCHVSGTTVAPRPGSVVSVSEMGRSQASMSSCLSSAMRG